MSEIRYNPFTDEWVIFAPYRQRHPDREGSCPFCPEGEEHMDFSHPTLLPNKYPSLNPETAFKKYRINNFFKK